MAIGDTNRPNGGILARFPGLYIPGLNVTFDGPAPTDTGYKTTDIAFQYDPIADFPQYPIDLLADLNAIAGFLGVHATYPNPYLPIPAGIPFFPTALPDGYTPTALQQAMADPANRQVFGDTTYITLPAINLPILQPLLDIGADTGTSWLTKPIVDLIQPTFRVLIELGYNRTIPYGQPTPAGLFPTVSPGTLGKNLVTAARQGIQDALTDVRSTLTGQLAPAASTPAQHEDSTPVASVSASTGRAGSAPRTSHGTVSAGASSAKRPGHDSRHRPRQPPGGDQRPDRTSGGRGGTSKTVDN